MDEKITRPSILHFRYCVGILLGIIVLLLTIKWAKIPELERLITFGLTLSSLLLALIAIVFTIFSHNSFSQSTATLGSASAEISKTTTKLTEATTGIERQLSQIPGLMEDVRHGQTRIIETLASQKFQSNASVPEPDEERVKFFLACSSYAGLRTLYACKLAKDNRILFVPGAIPTLGAEYTLGFIVASACAALVVYRYTQTPGALEITRINTHVETHLSSYINAVEQRLIAEQPQVFSAHLFQQQRTELESHFRAGPPQPGV